MPPCNTYTETKRFFRIYNRIMKRVDDRKVSLVEFLRSIKFSHPTKNAEKNEVSTHFAPLVPRARPAQPHSSEDASLVRSAN